MTIETAIRELATIVLSMEWQAFGGIPRQEMMRERAERILESFPESPALDVERMRREIRNEIGFAKMLSYTPEFKDGKIAGLETALARLGDGKIEVEA